jgi:Flp pilus assembly pilin Flp
MKNYILAHTGRFGRAAMQLSDDKRAVTSLEYALVASVIVATILVGFQSMASAINLKFSSIGTTIAGTP